MTNSSTVTDAIADFLEGACPGEVLSLAHAVNQIRRIFPQCDLTDLELAEIVVIRALEMGFVSVMYDLTRTEGGGNASHGAASAGRRAHQAEPRKKTIIAAMPKLGRIARKMAHDHEHADQILERALLVAIATIHSRASDQPFEEWLCGILRRIASASRRSH